MEERFYIQKQLVVVPFGKRFHAMDSMSKQLLFVHRFYKGDWDDEDAWHDAFNHWVGELGKVDATVIPKVVGSGEDEDGIYVVLSRLDGMSLMDLVNSGYMGIGAVMNFAAHLLEGCRAAEEVGIYHGAYDPRRITVGIAETGEQAFLVEDFGLPFIHCKIQKEEVFMGLPPFASIRQSRGEPQDAPGEMFSISQLLLYCLSVGHPYSSDGLAEIGAAYAGGHVPRFSDYRSDLPGPFLVWLETLAGVGGESGFESFEEALESLPEVIDEGVIDVNALTAAQHIQQVRGTAAVQAKPRLLTGGVGVQPAEGGGDVTYHPTSYQVPADQLRMVEGQGGGKLSPKLIGLIAAGVALLLGVIIFAVVPEDAGDDSLSDKKAEEEAIQLALEKERAEYGINLKGLKFAWNFDDSLDSSISGGVNVKALNRDRFAEGKHGKCLVMGINSYYRIPKVAGLELEDFPNRTVSFWFKSSIHWDRAATLMTNRAGERQLGWEIRLNPSTPRTFQFSWNARSRGASLNFKDYPTFVSDQWHLLSLVTKGNEETLFYQDGKHLGSVKIPKGFDSSTNFDLFLGCGVHQKGRFRIDVMIDELYIWHRSLDEFEIREMFNRNLRFVP